MSHKTKVPKGGNSKEELTRLVLGVFQKYFQQSFNYKQIASKISDRDKSLKVSIPDVLRDLKKLGSIDETAIGKYRLKKTFSYLEGIVDKNSHGAYIVCKDVAKDIFVSPRHLKTAMHGDTVKIMLYPDRAGKSQEGEVAEVLKRARTEFSGVVQILESYAFVVPDNKKMFSDIYVRLQNTKGAKDGQKVIVKIIVWAEENKNPEGEIIDVLGYPGENEAEMNAIMAEYGLPYKFPQAIDREAEKIELIITDEEVSRRRDFRNVTTFTIDPEDAKDFDDALSVKKLPNGHWEVGVHIADVSHYVTPGDPIDAEAQMRATSIYLVDRVVPMLPERLSNDICSLRPNENRYCFAAVFELNNDGDVLSEYFSKTIINSNRRFSYEEAQTIIETKLGDFSEEVLLLNDLAIKIRNQRMKAGAIEFSRDEIKVRLDEQFKPIAIYKKVPKESNKLIEEFMLLANRKVAEFIFKKNKECGVYRVHDLPSVDKLKEFSFLALRFGYKVILDNPKHIAHNLNILLEEIKDKPECDILTTHAIRSMAKAIYTTENIGHFGLAFEYYTHFTSPIRRYPDVMVHRLLHAHLEHAKLPKREFLYELCEHSSNMEKMAANAERDSIKYKQIEFLKDKVGQEYDGVITQITDWGVYVELSENFCEGMIRISEIEGDMFYFDEKNYCIKGKRFGSTYKLGDKIRIEIKSADLAKKQLDFKLIQI